MAHFDIIQIVNYLYLKLTFTVNRKSKGNKVQWQGEQYEINELLDAAKGDRRIITLLILNTYSVLLSRATKSMGIWFKDDATRKHVAECLKIN